jgi:hypothetical protein
LLCCDEPIAGQWKNGTLIKFTPEFWIKMASATEFLCNPSLCIRDGTEESVWRSKEHTDHIALGYKLSFQSFYEFKTDGRYTHYLFFKHPFWSSSCTDSMSPSMFQLFDGSNKSHIARKDFQLTLRYPDIDFDLAVKDFESFSLKFFWRRSVPTIGKKCSQALCNGTV